MSRVLVAYFSASGVTKKIAEELAKVEKADLYEIVPETLYTNEDLDWRNEQSRSTLEMKDPSCRPAIAGQVENIARYDTVFVGFPIWWGREPSVADPFLDAYDFTGKKIVPFCTSGGNGIRETAKRIQEIVGTAATVEEGTRLGGAVSEKDLETWTAGLRLYLIKRQPPCRWRGSAAKEAGEINFPEPAAMAALLCCAKKDRRRQTGCLRSFFFRPFL